MASSSSIKTDALPVPPALARPKSMQFEPGHGPSSTSGPLVLNVRPRSNESSPPGTPPILSSKSAGSLSTTPKWKSGFSMKDLSNIPSEMVKLASSVVSTPATDRDGKEDYFGNFEKERDKAERRAKEDKKRKKKKKRKEAEVFVSLLFILSCCLPILTILARVQITRHVAQIMARQEFICKLARAMMMFGAPSHRFGSFAVARCLETHRNS